MADYTKPGHTSLNMDDIEQDLHITRHFVKKLGTDKRIDNNINKPVTAAYRNLITKADDTDLVDGIEASRIAISVNGDRYTVENAKNLLDDNGDPHSFDDFMTASKGANMIVQSQAMSFNYNNDIADLRDELYQLKHELEKKGFIRNTNQHMGYNDIFRNGYKPYESKMLCETAVDAVNSSKLVLPIETVEKEIDEGDYLVFYFVKEDKTNVRQVKTIMPDHETIELSAPLDAAFDLSAGNIRVYKTYGVSKDGNFYFAKDEGIVIGDTIMYSGLDDDTAYKYRKPISTLEDGYAYSFRIPESKLGFLTKFDILVRATGTPALTCYIIDEQDIGYFRNPTQMETLYKNGDLDAGGEPKCHFFAKSAPLTLDPGLGTYTVSFDFFNTDTDSYPLLTRKDDPNNRVRYVAVITGTYIDANNFAEVYFLQDKEGKSDLQLNNTLYYYNEQSETSTTSALSTDAALNQSDMYYSVQIKERLDNAMEPVNQGLYSAKMNCSYPQGISRARLTLRFAREGGLWSADITEPSIVGGGTAISTLNCKSDPIYAVYSTTAMGLDEQIVKPLELRASALDVTQEPNLIIGNTITTGSASGTMVVPSAPVYTRLNDMVYRNAYVVSVKGKYYEYNVAAQRYEVKSSKKIYLKPLAVIPDGIKYENDTFSDRVIFEGDFTDDDGQAMFFNQLELQIYWQKMQFNENDTIKHSQMGIMHDLIFSTDCAVQLAD